MGFLKDHPGGAQSIQMWAGEDATADFSAVHSDKAWAQLDDYYVGELKVERLRTVTSVASLEVLKREAEETTACDAAVPLTLVGPKRAVELSLVSRVWLNHNTICVKFALPSPKHRLGLPTGTHVMLGAATGSKKTLRAYTPTSLDYCTQGHVELVVKVYRPLAPRFPAGGKMSQHLADMPLNSTIEFRGPIGHIVYEGCGQFTINKAPRTTSSVGLIAGGTGITPCFQILKSVLESEQDDTKVSLVFANNSEEDILLHSELNAYAAAHAGQFSVYHAVVDPPPNWTQGVGFITPEILKAQLPAPGPDTLIFACGPPIMLDKAVYPGLAAVGHADSNVFSF